MTKLRFRDITAAFGAEVEGLDTSAELSEVDADALRRAFDERALLLFRGIELEPAYQAYLASTVVGVTDAARAGTDADDGGAFFVSNRREGGGAPYGRLLFHSDMMWSDAPFQVLTLYAVDVEEPVVPTTFTCSTAAWESLPDELRARVEHLHATHVTGQQDRGDDEDGELLRPEREQVQSTSKPVANVHPRTGRTILYVSQMMTEKIDELVRDESESLLEELFAHLYGPALIWQHHWRNGDLVMWDNLAIQHARSDVKLDGPVRTLRKVIAPRQTVGKLPETPKFSKVS